MSDFLPLLTGIKSIQRGTTVANNTSTVTAVDTSKSILFFLGQSNTNSTMNAGDHARVSLTNSTTIQATAGYMGNAPTVSWQLVEYY